jgi:hypothetical protein
MEDRKTRCSRRKFLAQAAALTFTGGLAQASPAPESLLARPPRADASGRKPLAVLATVYRPFSFAHQLVARFLHGYPQGGRMHVPAHRVAGLYVEQTPANDLSREVAREFGARPCRSVADALTLGTGALAVDGVLLLAEHGNYPRNDRGQVLYPRFEMLEQVASVFRRAGQGVPVYVAKHLSYDPARARQMAAWARELRFPLMAGSSLPLTWRRPELELPAGAAVEEALVAAHGPVEVHGADALEALQAMVERRRGGETGVRAVTCLAGSAVWKAADAGVWSWDLLEAALARSETVAPGDVRRNVGRLAVQGMPATPPVAFVVEYRDGLRGTVLLLNGHVQDFTFAARLRGEPRPASCLFAQPGPPGSRHFDCLAAGIERLLETRQSPAPAERSVLIACQLSALMESHRQRGVRIETPDLNICCEMPSRSEFCRGSINGL